MRRADSIAVRAALLRSELIATGRDHKLSAQNFWT
jgi:hypothetical protein